MLTKTDPPQQQNRAPLAQGKGAAVLSLVPDITAGTGTESDETPGWWWPVGLSQSEGAHEMAVSVDGALFREQRLMKTGGRLLKHARYYWLTLAESHLTKRLFAGMVRRMGVLAATG
jgi:hypothetical protein